MRFHETVVAGARLIEPERRGDDRGFFARIFCERELAEAGLASRFVQVNNSLSRETGTLRGMHYQIGTDSEVKVMRCVRGAIWDMIVDLRPDSPTYLKSFGARLDDRNRTMMYVPRGCAHGVLTLEPDTEIIYFVSAFYAPASECGLRWNDPALGLTWPISPTEVSVKDQNWPYFDPLLHRIEDLRGLI